MPTRALRILVIDEEFPYPLDSGKRIRSYNLLSRLAARCRLHYLAYGTPYSRGCHALRAARMHPVPVEAVLPAQSGPAFCLRLFANLWSAHPYIVSRHHSRAFQDALARVVAALRPDLILCEWTPYAIFVRHLTHIPRVIVAHNIERRIWSRYLDHERSLFKKWYIGRQVPKVAAFEAQAFAWVDGAVAVSHAEAQEIRTLRSGLPVVVVENGVDPIHFTPVAREADADSLIFVGAMHWRPNQDAVVHFVEEILPLIQRRRPGVRFTVVGQNPPPHVLRLGARPGVEIVGRVEDVRPYVRSAAVYVVPLRIGGGTRLKILEALAMGKAVVSTAVGAEGLAVTPGENILLADRPQAFADSVERLLADPSLGVRLGTSGRELVETHYEWDRLADKLEEFLKGIVRDAGRPGDESSRVEAGTAPRETPVP